MCPKFMKNPGERNGFRNTCASFICKYLGKSFDMLCYKRALIIIDKKIFILTAPSNIQADDQSSGNSGLVF